MTVQEPLVDPATVSLSDGVVQEKNAQDVATPAPPADRTATPEEVIKETLAESADAFENPYVFKNPIKRVAVIGAGPSGISAGKAALENGLDVTVFERNHQVGGVWAYSEDVQPVQIPCDTNFYAQQRLPEPPTGNEQEGIQELTPELKDWINGVHAPPTACYKNLFNNTATAIMRFEEHPWPEDTPWYVSHTRVQQYISGYAQEHGLDKHIHLNTCVNRVEKAQDGSGRWELSLTEIKKLPENKVQIKKWTDTFDAVCVASGQHQTPFVPDFPQLKEFKQKYPARVIHAKQFRHYEDFKGKNILLIGGNVSAIDVARHLDGICDRIYMSLRNPFDTPSGILNLFRTTAPESLIHKPNVASFSADNTVDGRVTFVDGSVLDDIDVVVFCTGYITNFPFFGEQRSFESENKEGSLFVTNGKCVLDTYRDIFLARDPTLAFVGAPSHLINVDTFFYQGQTVGRVWAGLARLPNEEHMLAHIKARVLPFPWYDLNFRASQLNGLTLITWLNHHAELLGVDKKRFEGVSAELVDLYPTVESRWKATSLAMLKELKATGRLS